MKKQIINFSASLVLIFSLGIMVQEVNAQSTEKPNVIFFAVDDLNLMINPLGYHQAKTPNMDKLAESGVLFTNAHAPSSYCAPSRTAIWTGLQASTTGCYTNEVFHYDYPNLATLQMAFKRGGYNNFGAGKLYHHRPGYVDLRDWDEFFGRNKEMKKGGYNTGYHGDDLPLPNPYPYSSYHRKTDQKLNGGRFMEWGPIPDKDVHNLMDNQRTDYICEVLKREHKKPFFAALGLYIPHYPNYVPQEYWDMYDEDKIIIPDIKRDDFDDLPQPIKKQMQNRFKIYQRLEGIGAMKEAVKAYLAAVSYADGMLGKVLDALEESKYKDNTIIVFWSDHGYHLGQKGNWGKHQTWQETTRVPFFIAGAGLPKDVKVDETVGLIDIYPTLIDLCKLTKPHEMDGQSLAYILENPAASRDRDLFIPHHNRGTYAVVNQNWRFIHYDNDSEELYDLKNDPNEYDNLANKEKFNDVKARLRNVAPEFRESATPANSLKLVLEGEETFHWVSKDGSEPQGKY